MTILNYAGGIRERGKPFFDYNNFKYEFPNQSSFKFGEAVTEDTTNHGDFQDDKDAPNGTVSVRIVKGNRVYRDKKLRVTKKFYKLEDGRDHIVELEEV